MAYTWRFHHSDFDTCQEIEDWIDGILAAVVINGDHTPEINIHAGIACKYQATMLISAEDN